MALRRARTQCHLDGTSRNERFSYNRRSRQGPAMLELGDVVVPDCPAMGGRRSNSLGTHVCGTATSTVLGTAFAVLETCPGATSLEQHVPDEITATVCSDMPAPEIMYN